MILPPRIAPGATIGVVTLATPAETRAVVQRGVEWWESQGYRVKLGASTRERGGDFAGPPELRAADLQAMFADPEIAAIQTMRGGYGTTEVVPLSTMTRSRRARRRSSASRTSRISISVSHGLPASSPSTGPA